MFKKFSLSNLLSGFVFLVFFLILNIFAMCSTSLAKQQNSLELLGDMFSLSPFWSWKTIETTHFRITFPKELSSQAQKSAQYFEEAHSILSPILKWEPRNKTQILIIDNSDMANGVTSPALRLGIVLYMVPPDNWESIFYEDNWLRLLVFHEYTHFLNMDPTHGVWTGLRYIFGDILLPNAFWPAWMLEGLAVYIETHFTKVGRGRSPFYEGLLRSAVEQNVFNSSKFITFDKIFGENPYFPGGETPYLFGYHLMNWIAKKSPHNINSLGELSEYSSYCFPWLLDYYLNKTASTNWKKTWTEWVDFTQDRLKKEIEQIKSQPLTPIKKITEKGFSVLGSSASPNGNWLAYTQNSLDRRWSLYLRNLNTKETTRLDEKFFGAHLDFSPDSRFLVYSALHRMSQYYYFSDLAVYDLNEKRSYWLTNSLRAKDPSYSKDGKWIVFTLTENSRVGIAIASVMYGKNRLKLGEVQKLFMPEMFDRSASPIFSPDGKKIIFSLHKTNHTSEEIVELDLEDHKYNETKISHILIENKSYNRHPAFDATGNLYFVSDFTGIDNVFKLKQNTAQITQVTNVIAGVWFPTFGPKGIYASIFSVDGFDLAQIELLEKPISESQPIKKTTDWAPPVYKSNEDRHALENKTYTDLKDLKYNEKNYSVFPSILPRLWYPIIFFDSSLEGYVGGQVAGFDATDRHQYVLGTGYAFKQKKVDGFVQYTTRLLGPNLSYAWSYVTSATENNGDIFYRKLTHSASLAYPWRFTSSTLTPSISLFLEREYKYNLGDTIPTQASQYIPAVNFNIAFTNPESSRLAISPERGRNTFFGTKLSLNSGINTWKFLFKDTEYITIGKHHVLVPFLRTAWSTRVWSTRIDPNNLNSNIVVQGFIPSSLFNSFKNSLDALTFRGYPGFFTQTRLVNIGSLDYRFPLSYILKGFETFPFFVENLFGFTFVEAVYFPNTSLFLPSLGAGIRLASQAVFRLPLVFSVEYHIGLKSSYGGQGQAIVALNLNAFEF